jgi:hypothetical protein
MVKPKPGYRLREGDQVPTRPTTIPAIMAQPTFLLGVSDARNGRGYHADYDLWHGNDQWAYERGRMWASLTPRDIRLKLNGKITSEAIGWFRHAGRDIL